MIPEHTEDTQKSKFLQIQNQWQNEITNYEFRIGYLEESLIALGKVLDSWQTAFRDKAFKKSDLAIIRPAVASLMTIPPQTRIDLFGNDLEEFYAKLKTDSY